MTKASCFKEKLEKCNSPLEMKTISTDLLRKQNVSVSMPTKQGVTSKQNIFSIMTGMYSCCIKNNLLT